MKWRKYSAIAALLLATLSACSRATSVPPIASTPPESIAITPQPRATAPYDSSAPAIRSFFILPSPESLVPVVRAIENARSSIHMIMFHLTDEKVAAALIDARARGVDVHLLLDAKILAEHRSTAIANRLSSQGVEIIASSPGFSITHAKAFVIDRASLTVMSANLTGLANVARDFGVTTDDADAVNEFLRVFDADITNARASSHRTPPLTSTALIWSPVDSETRITDLIDEARVSIVANTENMGDPAIEAALVRAAQRGVNVRLIVPLCDLNPEPLFNVASVRRLDASQVKARVMPSPSNEKQPYVHAKMTIIDDRKAFIGSINFSKNSMRHARELGIVFSDRAAIDAFTRAFESDWSHAIAPPDDTSHACRNF